MFKLIKITQNETISSIFRTKYYIFKNYYKQKNKLNVQYIQKNLARDF
jgi:hypothetical protein